MATLKVPVTVEDHMQGDIKAPIVLVEYGDYECPACGAAYPLVKLVQKHFGENLCFVFRNFPLTEMHPHAALAAETAEFAVAHDAFWQAHDLLYENQDHLSLPFMISLVESLHLSVNEYKEQIQNKVYEEKIQKDFIGGVRSGVNGTPTFFINGVRYDGGLENLIPTIEAILKQ